jgi:hypothetical protein
LAVSRDDAPTLYRTIADLLKDIIPFAQYNRMTNEDPIPDDLVWVDKVPTTHFYEVIPQLTAILDENTADNKLSYTWSVIRDNLQACQLYISWSSILIRPLIPPSLSHNPFKNAKQRVFMSATLGPNGDLERITGIPTIHRLPIPDGWDKQGLGRRLFFFPEATRSEEDALKVVTEMTKCTNRSLILVPDDRSAMSMTSLIQEDTNNTVFTASEIEQSKSVFVNSKHAVAILANRFDGIDLVDDECRLLVIKGLPRATHLQERFITNRMASSILFEDRVRTRVVQAVGRCTRSAVDYAAICVLGQELTDELVSEKKLRYFHPELQAEILYGHDQSLQVQDADEMLENLDIFLRHDEEWNAADDDILKERDERVQQVLDASEKLLRAAKYEVEYQYALWKLDFDSAINAINSVLDIMTGDDVKGYRGLWYYLKGSTAWLAAQHGVQSYANGVGDSFRRAAQCTASVTWLHHLVPAESLSKEEETDQYLAKLIEGLEERIVSMGTTSNRKFEREINSINRGLDGSGTHFEAGHERIGWLLGFTTGNTEEDAGPDPWWIVSDDLCFVFEDKLHERDKTPIAVKDVRQAAGHPAWIRKNITFLKPTARIVSVILTNSTSIDSAAVTFADGVYYWNVTEFRKWAYEVVQLVRTLRQRFYTPGDLVWRSEAMQMLKESGKDPISLLGQLVKSSLMGLPQS